MATKLDDPCLKNAADDEPIFVLRAQDITSPHVIHFWLSMNPQVSDETRKSAMRVATSMLKWSKKKLPD